MSSVCVCGHPAIDHTEIVDEYNIEIGRDDCLNLRCFCEIYRPVLSWPDSEGWWWAKCPWDWPMLLLAYCDDDKQMWLTGRGRGFKQSDFEQTFGPARFTRLLEQNPFGEWKEAT